MLDFMGWMRKQPLPKRRRSNPNRTYNNKVSYVAIFLKEFGVSRGGRHPPRNAVRESAPLTANRVA